MSWPRIIRRLVSVPLCRPYCRFNIEHCVKDIYWIHYGTLNIFSFESRALSACCFCSCIFAGCGTHTPDQSTAYMQGTAQADSAFYLQQMQQSSDDTRINWQLLAIRALVKEGKTGQAVELFNQLPQELNDSQRREKTLLAVEIKLAQKDFAGAQNLLAKITPADLEQNQQARYRQVKVDQPGASFH